MRPFGLIALLAVCAVAARASAAPAPSVFRLSITGTSTAEWDHTGAPTLVGGCQITVRSEGVRVARFRSSRPTVVSFVSGKIRTVALRVLTGTVTLTGHNTVTENCGGPELRTTEQSCAKTTRRFTNGRTTLTSSSAGRVTVRALRATLRRADCPREPADVVASPLGPPPTPLRISTSTLANARIAKITLTASRTRRKDFGDPQAGSLAQRSRWTITLVRVAR
jgi:uncharacterized protein YndB with AHSA1/START domain